MVVVGEEEAVIVVVAMVVNITTITKRKTIKMTTLSVITMKALESYNIKVNAKLGQKI